MTRKVARLLVWSVPIALGTSVTLAGALLVALLSTGVLSTAEPGWITEVRVMGRPITVNVPGVVRFATAPGVARLLDGNSLNIRAGRLRFAREGSALHVQCDPCRLSHPDLAPAPVTIRSIRLTIERSRDELAGVLVVDTLQVPLTAQLAVDRIEVNWSLPATELANLYRAFGTAIPEARYARIEGTIQAQGRMSLPSRKSSIVFGVAGIEVGGLATEHLQYGGFRLRCTQRSGDHRVVITGDAQKAWIAADAMGPYLAAAVLAAEDQRFHEHAGFDLEEITASLAELGDGHPAHGKLRGASTITQQLARTLYTGSERTAVRKLRELLYAIEMERTLGKARVLELYLNTVDWGPGLCGAKAAARAYFNKSPSKLTPIEAAWLAGILRHPHLAHAAQFVPQAPERDRAQSVLMQMREFPRPERARWAKDPLAFANPKNRPGAPSTAQATMPRSGLPRAQLSNSQVSQ